MQFHISTTSKQISVHLPSPGLDLASSRSVLTHFPPRPTLMHDESAYQSQFYINLNFEAL